MNFAYFLGVILFGEQWLVFIIVQFDFMFCYISKFNIKVNSHQPQQLFSPKFEKKWFFNKALITPFFWMRISCRVRIWGLFSSNCTSFCDIVTFTHLSVYLIYPQINRFLCHFTVITSSVYPFENQLGNWLKNGFLRN